MLKRLITTTALTVVFGGASVAQTLQPATITTTKGTPEVLQVLDKTGQWARLGTLNAGTFFNNNAIWSDDYLRVSGSDCGSLQAAYSVLATTGGTIHLPRRKLDTGTTCQVLINQAAVDWEGEGWSESFGNGMTPPTAAPYYGSWIEVRDPHNSLFLLTGRAAAGTRFRNVALSNAAVMPIPSATFPTPWAPTVMPPVIDAENTGGYLGIENVYCYATYECVKGFNLGRMSIRGLYGQSFKATVEIDDSLDANWIDEVHAWGFWSYNANVVAWENQNSDVFLFGRVDGPFIGRAFGINKRSIAHFFNSGFGVTSRFAFNTLHGDGTRWTVWIDSTAQNVAGNIAIMDGQHFDNTISVPFTNGALFRVDSDPAFNNIQVGIARDEASDSVLDLRASGGNTISIAQLIAQGWSQNISGGTSPLVGVKNGGTKNFVIIDKLQIFVPPNTLYSNATTDFVTLKYAATQAGGNDFNTYTTETFAHGIRDLAHGSIFREADGIIWDKAAGNALFNSGATSAIVLGALGQCGVWINAVGLIPGLADGTTAGCSNQVGSGARPWGSGWFTALNVIDSTTSTQQQLTVGAPSGTNGGGIKLVGNGVTTPNKFMRVFNGNWQIVSSDYSTPLLTVDDIGNVTLSGNVTAISVQYATVLFSTISSLCTIPNRGKIYLVGDAASVIYHGAVSGGGTAMAFAGCDGSTWTYQ